MLMFFCLRKTHHEPIKTWSAVDGQEICLKLYCNCGPGDNPAQSEVCSHIGAKGNYPCRKCNVGGSQKEKETDQGFHEFFSVSQLEIFPSVFVLKCEFLYSQGKRELLKKPYPRLRHR